MQKLLLIQFFLLYKEKDTSNSIFLTKNDSGLTLFLFSGVRRRIFWVGLVLTYGVCGGGERDMELFLNEVLKIRFETTY